MWTIILMAAAVAAAFYYIFVKPHNYWIDRGVKQAKVYPVFGNSFTLMFRLQSVAELTQDLYNSCPGTRYSGLYQLYSPTLLIKEPELLKQVMVKDFDHFVDHRSFIPEDIDPYWAKNLFALTGQKWRDMRSTLSPAFTSSKMKHMFTLIIDCANQFSRHFVQQDQKLIDLELKDAFTRFANDVIGTTAFGVKCNSLEEPENEFYLMGKKATSIFNAFAIIKFVIYLVAPIMSKVIHLGLFPKNVSTYFYNLVTDSIKIREEKGIIRPDMIHLLMEARKHGLKHEESETKDTGFATIEESNIGKSKVKVEINDLAITAQALIFFLAGFDTVSAAMCLMAYELGINPDVQQKLIEEIDETHEACNGKVSYETLLGMKYMDMVVSETLRLWPPATFADRICTKPYTIEAQLPGEKPLELEKGALIWVPVYAIHRDPNNFPEPNRFDPERFNDENKDNIKPYTYMPFGMGPRACIGSRFALLEVKALFFYLLRNFEIVPTAKSTIPLRITRKNFNMGAEDGFWFGLKRRETV